MAGKSQDLMPKVAVSATINAEIAGRLSAERNKSAIIEEALTDYYIKKGAIPPEPPKKKLIFCPACNRKTDRAKDRCELCGTELPEWLRERKEASPQPPEEKVMP
jgi:hypothetical protein